MEIPVLSDLVVVIGLSIGVILVCHRFNIPPLIGFLLTGILAGPQTLGLVGAAHEVEILAEIGVILLLFVIGMELSFDELLRLRKSVFLGGTAQVLLTIIIFDGLVMVLGFTYGRAVFAGFLAALSSTAIVLKLLSDRAELGAPHGRISLGILIFQDIVVVPMMLLVPFLTGKAGNLGLSLLLLGAKSAGIIGVLYILSKFVIPRLLLLVVRTRSRELFLLTTLALCFSIALLTSKVGLSLSLGAFLAGLLISESEYSLSALEGILPFRDVFTSVFFISIGMLLDVGFFLSNLWLVLLLSLVIVIVKGTIASGAALLLRYPFRVAVLTGLSLCQIGEFSFVLAGVGLSHGLLAPAEYQLFLAVAILTMGATPFLIMAAPKISSLLSRGMAPWERPPAISAHHEQLNQKLEDHLIIVGFGVGGRHLAQAAKMAGIRYVILEMNPDTVRTERARGEPIFFGDAAMAAVLEQAGVTKARILAVVIADPAAVRRIVEVSRKASPNLRIVVRTRFLAEIQPLRSLGANEVIPEEFETSIEIFTRVMASYLVPLRDIERFVADVRSENYGILCEPGDDAAATCEMSEVLTGYELAVISLDQGVALEGKTLQEAALRKEHGLNLVAVKRDGTTLANPSADFRLQAGDQAYIFGEHRNILSKRSLFQNPQQSEERPSPDY